MITAINYHELVNQCGLIRKYQMMFIAYMELNTRLLQIVMTDIEEKLLQKSNELASLQQEFDEFVESSKEIETELENEIKILKENIKKASNSEDKAKLYSDKCTQLTNENIKISEENHRIKEVLQKLENEKRNLGMNINHF